jgi:chromosome segregation ATPase
MPSRRASGPGDSLELLLDTICNAFGGILFLTILLTMLLRLSHPKTDSQAATETARHEMIELSSQLEMILSELETLENSLAVQTETRARLASAELEARYAKLEELRERRQEVERSLCETTQSAAHTQQQIDAVAARHETLDHELTQARERVSAEQQ